jgi:hypothetical protein
MMMVRGKSVKMLGFYEFSLEKMCRPTVADQR